MAARNSNKTLKQNKLQNTQNTSNDTRINRKAAKSLSADSRFLGNVRLICKMTKIMRRILATLCTAALFTSGVGAQPAGENERGRGNEHTGQHYEQHYRQHWGQHSRGFDNRRHHRPHLEFHPGMHIDVGLHHFGDWHCRTLLDAVHLKNGSQMVGLVVETVPEEYVRLVTYDGSIFVFRMDEIEVITKTYGRWSRIYRRSLRDFGSFNKPKGYFGIAEVGVAPMFLSENIRIGVSLINGYRVSHNFALGLGTGFMFYPQGAEYTIPLFLHLRSDFFDRARTPFVSLNVGGQFQVSEEILDIHKGFFVEPSIGYGFNTGQNQRCNVSIGLAMEMYEDYEGYRYLDTGCCLKFGYAF